MKKTIQKIVQMVMVAAVMLPSVSNAQIKPGTASIMKWGGGAVAVIGGIAWSVQDDEVTKCKNAGTSGCSNLSDLEDSASLKGALALVGAGVMVLGFALDDGSGFHVRPTQDGGVAVERKGFSFSTNVKGQSKLQKRWEF